MRATAAEETQTGGLVLLVLRVVGHSRRGPSVARAPIQRASCFSSRCPRCSRSAWRFRAGCFRSTCRTRSSALAALADLGIGLIYFAAGALGYGAGEVRAVTYEYGNAFLIVAGLLNLLVVIDAYDIAMGRK